MIEQHKPYQLPRIEDMRHIANVPDGTKLFVHNRRIYATSLGRPLFEVTVNGLVAVEPPGSPWFNLVTFIEDATA